MKSPVHTTLLVARGLLTRRSIGQLRFASSEPKSEHGKDPPDESTPEKKIDQLKKKQKSMADLDEEMKRAMENLSGEGGEYGMELEGGKPVSMKRSVKENMFRYI